MISTGRGNYVRGDFHMGKRTDLALEAKELWEESAEETTELPGVAARETEEDGVRITSVEILDERGEEALGKPTGTYLTLELQGAHHRARDGFQRAAEVLGRQLRSLLGLKKGQSVLVAGLGNRAVTPDVIGPKTVDHLLVTRHLVSQLPQYFADYRPVAAVSPGVLGTTGLESAEVVHGVVQRAHPDCLIVVDALASCNLGRICTTIQLADTGIVPGSGIHNAREAFNRQRFGIPVIAVGVPTVVDLDTLVAQYAGDAISEDRLRQLCGGQQLVVTPRDIDAKAAQIAKLVAYGINLALHEGLAYQDIGDLVE